MRTITILPFGSALALLLLACSTTRSPDMSFAPATFTEQVARGQELFAENCASCHGDAGQGGKGPRLVGLREGALPLDPPASRKVRTMRFLTVGDVAQFVVANMPPKKAGTLSTEEYLAVLAFDLKANGIDLGSEKLTLEKAKTMMIPR